LISEWLVAIHGSPLFVLILSLFVIHEHHE
jgi:hypothetical protein